MASAVIGAGADDVAVGAAAVAVDGSVRTTDGEFGGPHRSEAREVRTDTTVAMPAVESATFQSAETGRHR